MNSVFEIFDERMRELLLPDSSLEQLATGATWSEGPVYLAKEDAVIWSDIPGNRLLRWSAREGLREFLKPAHFQNGHTLDLEGRILACSHGERAVLRLESDGHWTTVVSHHQGKRLNSPNDIVVKSDGTIWFTDPDYGLIQPHEGYGGKSEQAGCFVYRFDPRTNEMSAVVTDMQRPNGLAFSPDETLLYITDTSASHDANGFHHVRVYDITDERSAKNGRLFTKISPGLPDGFRLDIHGNLFISSEDSVQIYTSEATCLGKINVPEKVGNLTFGSSERNRLFIAASSSLYAITLNTTGCVYGKNQ
jgi:gluconolactonase